MSNSYDVVKLLLQAARLHLLSAEKNLKLAQREQERVAAERQTYEDRDVLYGIQDMLSISGDVVNYLDWYIDCHAGEVEE